MVYYPEDFKYTIKDIFAQSQSENKPMLSNYNSDFWAGYVSNYNYFDRRFKKLYTSWFPFDQDAKEGRQYVADEFRADVYAHLMANEKRYTELYRVNVLPDNEAYSLTNNVDYTEEYSEESHLDRTFNKGSQTDGGTSFTTYGEQENSEDRSRTIGATGSTAEKSISAFNESSYSPTEKTEYSDDEHTDTEDNTFTLGSHRDDSGSQRTEGAREDTTDDDGTKEYTLHKSGNMGVQTVDDMLDKHIKVWSMFDFYGFIFAEIARDLLRGCD